MFLGSSFDPRPPRRRCGRVVRFIGVRSSVDDGEGRVALRRPGEEREHRTRSASDRSTDRADPAARTGRRRGDVPRVPARRLPAPSPTLVRARTPHRESPDADAGDSERDTRARPSLAGGDSRKTRPRELTTDAPVPSSRQHAAEHDRVPTISENPGTGEISRIGAVRAMARKPAGREDRGVDSGNAGASGGMFRTGAPVVGIGSTHPSRSLPSDPGPRSRARSRVRSGARSTAPCERIHDGPRNDRARPLPAR